MFEKRHLIMGTAGHVDHGKTTLIRALTGIDCDTHKEEKRRGITINLGFAHLDLPSGDSVGIVDVPGHGDFVHTMVGGASGVDFALLLVAADGGVMPQTREHLEIMSVLGIEHGLVAMSRVDLVDDEMAELAEQEIHELLDDASTGHWPVVRVSALTGQGLDELKQKIGDVAARVRVKSVGEVFRMFVDRIFTVSGFGTVVTGSVTSGRLKLGETAYLLPGEKELRTRGMQRHGEDVEEVVAGDRASINLVGLERSDFRRGMIVSDRALNDTTMLDARLRLFRHRRKFNIWSNVIFHLGTYEDSVRIHLLDRNSLGADEEAIVQIHLSKPCVAQQGDRFVIRNTSRDLTLGGGEIIDRSPLHHRRRPGKLIRNLEKLAEGDFAALVASEARKKHGAVSCREVANSLNVSLGDVVAVVESGLVDDIAPYTDEDGGYLLVDSERSALRNAVIKQLTAFHRRNPLEAKGRTADELTGTLGIERSSASDAVLRSLLAEMEEEGRLKKVGQTWALCTHYVEIGPDISREIDFVEHALKICGMQTPLMSDLTLSARRRKIDEHQLRQYLRYLVSNARAYHVDGNYIHADIVDGCRDTLVSALAREKQGLTVADFRNLVSGNRKICLLLLGLYDAEGTTQRKGDYRVPGEKARLDKR